MCIEHRGGVWQLKPVSSKGKDVCLASVPGGCAMEACTSRVWRVNVAFVFYDQPSVEMVTGAEAERAVSSPCIGASHKPQTLKPQTQKHDSYNPPPLSSISQFLFSHPKLHQSNAQLGSCISLRSFSS